MLKTTSTLALLFALITAAFSGTARAESIHLPPDFKFCVATAAHQIEGNNVNSDWWEWEQIPGKIKNGDHSTLATDAWAHFNEDVLNMSYLGVDTYRFSVEWAKIEPAPGQFDEAVLEEYASQLRRLRLAGISPMITLQHFVLPLWVAKKGGWEWKGITPAFERYTEKVVGHFKRNAPAVRWWVTINEPMSTIGGGYIRDIFPPGKNDIKSIGLPMENMIRAHAASYHALHRLLDTETFQPMVGLVQNLAVYDPEPSHPLAYKVNAFAARKFEYVANWSIPFALKTGHFKINIPFMVNHKAYIPEAAGTQDYFGLNYYTRNKVSFNLLDKEIVKMEPFPGKEEYNDLGWEIYPQGLDRMITKVRKYFPNIPIWITENGVADATDEKRIRYVRNHLSMISKHIDNGAPILGYCHWTLNDNFEWAEGYRAKFGFYSIDPVTFNRIPRQSAHEFSELTRECRMPAN